MIKNAVFINKRVVEDLALYKKMTGEYDDEFAESHFGSPDECTIDLLITNYPNSDDFRFWGIANNPAVTEYHWLVVDNTGQIVVDATTTDPYYDPIFAVRPEECTATFWLTKDGVEYGPWVLDYYAY